MDHTCTATHVLRDTPEAYADWRPSHNRIVALGVIEMRVAIVPTITHERPDICDVEASRQLESGGAGIRTPVREEIHYSVYVRSPPFDVSVSWPMDLRLPDEPPRSRPLAVGAPSRLSQICDTCKNALGGLPCRHSAQLRVTQREPSCCWQLEISRVFYQEPEYLGTRPRLHLSRRNQSPP